MDGRKILAVSFLLALLVVRSRSQNTGVRLVGGSTPNEGRVEVYYNGTWGTVCDDSWRRTDASVVCRMLGYSRALSALGHAYFGRGTGKIWLDDVGCSGSENSLFDCNHSGWGDHDCSHFEDAGVVCGDLCPCPQPPSHGSTGGCTGNGTRVSFSCDRGYRLVGSSGLWCNYRGVWSGITPTCQPAPVPEPRCRCPRSPTNGYTIGCLFSGSRVSYICNYAYELVGGDETRRCLPSGSWSGSAPYCSRNPTTLPTFTTDSDYDSDALSNLQLAEYIIAVITTVPTFACFVIICIVSSLFAAGKCCCSANARNRPVSTFPLQQTRMEGNRQTQPLQNPQTIGRGGENQEHVFTGPNSDLPSYVTVVCHPDEFKEVCPQDPLSLRGPLPSFSGPGDHPPSSSDGGSIGESVGGCDD